jgi:hypothetical protein
MASAMASELCAAFRIFAATELMDVDWWLCELPIRPQLITHKESLKESTNKICGFSWFFMVLHTQDSSYAWGMWHPKRGCPNLGKPSMPSRHPTLTSCDRPREQICKD